MTTILDRPSVRRAALPITVTQYHGLGRQGIIREPTELLRGVIIEQMTKSPLHTYIVRRLVQWLDSVVGGDRHVRKKEPLTLTDSEPEPDVAVVGGSPEDYRTDHPATADLVVEVAVATLDLDRDKADVYADAGIPEYWIVVPEERVVEVFREPSPSGYRSHLRHTDPDDVLRPLRLPQASICLGAIL